MNPTIDELEKNGNLEEGVMIADFSSEHCELI
jgi:hypothetical protein